MSAVNYDSRQVGRQDFTVFVVTEDSSHAGLCNARKIGKLWGVGQFCNQVTYVFNGNSNVQRVGHGTVGRNNRHCVDIVGIGIGRRFEIG